MDRRDMILGNACVERGWLSGEELGDCLRESGLAGPGRSEPASLSSVLLKRRLIPEDELAALRAELSKLLEQTGDPLSAREEDLSLAHDLRDSGRLSQEHLDEALTLEKRGRGMRGAPTLRQILLERGHVTLSALEEAVRAQKAAGIPVVCRSCTAASSLPRYDPSRVYLCKACTGELAPASELKREPLAPAPMPAQIDREAARYGPREEIGRGGIGVVYKARDEAHHRWVAIKVIKDTGRIEELTRFRREIEIARSLHHPNIVAVYEVTHSREGHEIAMEFVDGKTVAGLKLPPKWAAELVLRIALAVQYAHSRGVIHRDIKPQNIMVDRGGKPYLMDFGLAKSASSSSITSVGIAMGTPSYMAPEQAIGRTSRVDRRSDVYSLGAVLYDLVTGCPPFRGANPLATLRKVVDELPVPPSRIEPGVPQVLEGIIMRCMQKDKNLRYQTAKHLADDLERFARGAAI